MRRSLKALAIASLASVALTGCSTIEHANDTFNDVKTSVQNSNGSNRGNVSPSKDESVNAAEAIKTLNTLPVHAEEKASYNREKMYGQAWDYRADGTERTGKGSCNTRDEILARDLQNAQIASDGCKVLSGTLIEPYTGKTVTYKRGSKSKGGNSEELPIDHIVALSEANRSGGAELTQQQRHALANDPLNLITSDRVQNSDRKGDKDAAGFIPPNPAFQCKYVDLQIQVKAKYGLSIDKAEHDAMQNVLDKC